MDPEIYLLKYGRKQERKDAAERIHVEEELEIERERERPEKT